MRERSGWRDERISRRHRDWGWDCPVVDIDWLVAEYDHAKPVAIIEYKHEQAPPIQLNSVNCRVLAALGDMARLPVFIVRYADDFSWLRIAPLNALAKQWLPQRAELSEPDFVALLYRVRGREMPADLFSTEII